MGRKGQAYTPLMRDETVKAKSGRGWVDWFRVLDKAGAAKLPHRGIVAVLSKDHKVPDWWCQMVTVEYERARGLRTRHQTASGFSVNVTKTVATELPTLFAAVSNTDKRKQWFPKGTFELSSETKDKYFRGAWNKTSRLEMGFYAKGAGKAQIAIQIGKLPSKASVERERSLWKNALTRLAERLG